jgi:D-threo-aldose 1-dehydrogenase
VSRLGLGSVPLGGLYEPVSEEAARVTVRRAFDHGLRLFDTAPLYGLGLSERRIGAAVRDLPRSSFVLATKVGRLLRHESDLAKEEVAGEAPDVDGSYLHGGVSMFKHPTDVKPVWDFSRDGVLRSLEESLERLQLDRVDMVYVHDPEEHMDTALAEAVPALLELRDQGVVSAVGAGVDHVWSALRFVREADIDMVLIAGRCTLLDQSAVPELFPLCEERGVGVVAASVFHGGILADPVMSPIYWYEPASREIVARAVAMRDACARYSVPLRAAAIKYPLRYPAVVTVVVGARSPDEVDEDVAAFAEEIPVDLWAELDALADGVPASS